MRAAVVALGLLAVASEAVAEPFRSGLTPDGKGVLVYPGERITVRLAEGAPAVVDVAAASSSDALPPKPGRKGPEAPVDLGGAPQGAATFILSQAGPDLALKIDSGLEQAFDYRAVSTEGGELAACTVLPLISSYEKWDGRHAVALRLGEFRFKATNEVVCSKSSPTSPQ
ncbi:hypothetical protein [Phenylobacterium deserti]|uniref:Uncharacterized protein n=1 Tax=Phenylobacterium deserti TaxID=1914756 RepID=A0A328ASN7_9CAUL|nr:hypothetical protein [Phenylobacterium deserti]RAK58000.1 hypothetical protein DJ018_08855 [Phenylobacterium deserti]